MNETPTQSPDQGPEHWADLCENDVIQDGDEWELDGLWHPAEAIGCRVGDIGNRYRRRVAPEPTAEQASEPCSTGDAAETIERNPKSWAAWKREAERLEQRIAELERERDEAKAEAMEQNRLLGDSNGRVCWLEDEAVKLRAQLAASEKDRELILPIVRDFVQKNPKHDFRGVEQDPWGSHALLARLERFDALKEGK